MAPRWTALRAARSANSSWIPLRSGSTPILLGSTASQTDRSIDPVRLEDSADERLDDTVDDDIVDGSDVTLVLVVEPRLGDREVPVRELPLLDANGVLEAVGLDGPKVGMQGASSG